MLATDQYGAETAPLLKPGRYTYVLSLDKGGQFDVEMTKDK